MKLFTHKEKVLEVSIHGNIYLNKKKLNKYNNGAGYLTVSISGDSLYVQRVVCEAFHGKPINSKMQANHLNGVRWDNRASNLRWDTSSDNHKHAWRELGRVHARNQSLRKGAQHQYSKPVDQLDIYTKEVLKTFASIKEAADFFNVDPTAIYNSITKRNRSKYCKGFDWRYNPNGNQYKRKYTYSFIDGVKKRKINQ